MTRPRPRLIAAAALGIAAFLTACGQSAGGHPAAGSTTAASTPAGPSPTACTKVMNAVTAVATKAKINLSAGSMHTTISPGDTAGWSAELGRAFPHEAHPNTGDRDLEQKVITAETDALAVNDSASASTFITDLQAIEGACAVVIAENPASPSPSPSPTPTRVRTRTRVIFRVRGSAPSGADITYGSDSDSISPPGGLGALGTGAPVPFTGSIRYRSDALYFAVTAQLQGSGDITCSVAVKVTVFFSDGTHHSKSRVIAHGHAAGGYNICDAQANN